MSAFYDEGSITIHNGDCREVLATLPDWSVDAVVCDPPYGLEFMGKDWDGADGFRRSLNAADAGRESVFGRMSRSSPEYRAFHLFQEWTENWATEALRVLKPGGHLLAFGGTRTYHRMACAIEDVGFEIRDSLHWLYGSGFPKSLDVSKAIDKAARGVPQGGKDPTSVNHGKYRTQATEGRRHEGDAGRGFGAGPGQFMAEAGEKVERVLVEEATEWEGWGTALKPSHEPIIVARKPLAGTVATNVEAHGTGAMNIDACRVGWGSEGDKSAERKAAGYSEVAKKALGGVVASESISGFSGEVVGSDASLGRWPPNVLLSPETAEEVDHQTGILTSGANPSRRGSDKFRDVFGDFAGQEECEPARGADRGGASRFYPIFDPPFRYVAKPAQSERSDGLGHRPVLGGAEATGSKDGQARLDSPRTGADRNGNGRNPHPTVKPVGIMRWLIRLVTPPGGVVLDPFLGSGTTAIAAWQEDRPFIGVELSTEYCEVAVARIAAAGIRGVQQGMNFDADPALEEVGGL